MRETRLTDGERAYKLTTTAAGPLAVDAIAKSELTVRSIDWHPVEQYLEFEDEGGMRSLDLKELSFAIFSMDTYRLPSITEEPPLVRPKVAPCRWSPLVPLPPVPPSEIELLEAETQARYALHRMGACTGEPVEVSREPGVGVIVRGLVETAERKRGTRGGAPQHRACGGQDPDAGGGTGNKQRAGQPRRRSPHPRRNRLHSASAVTHAGKADKIPIEPQLRAYFNRLRSTSPLGGQHSETASAETDEAITALSNQSISLSEAALMEAWALRRLAEAYPRGKD